MRSGSWAAVGVLRSSSPCAGWVEVGTAASHVACTLSPCREAPLGVGREGGFPPLPVGVAQQPPLRAADPTASPGPDLRTSCVLGPFSALSSPNPSVPSEIFPYLVVVIGLENVLVLTRSVVSTPVDLEVKLRIAQGN